MSYRDPVPEGSATLWQSALAWRARACSPSFSRLTTTAIQRDPFTGIGKPEPLKGELSGYWSRRVDDEHRLVYRAHDKDDKEVKVLKARYRYSD